VDGSKSESSGSSQDGREGRGISIGRLYEEFAAEYGWTREYIQGRWRKGRLIGLTRPLLKLYWKYLQERKLEDLKRQIRLLGGRVDEKTIEQKEAEAKKKLIDPLWNFPEDIEYFDGVQCRQKISVSNRFGLNWPKEKLWNDYRMNACLGKYGIVAKRASMNDVLWGLWLTAYEKGKELLLDDLKKRIKYDLIRRKLYPDDYMGDGSDPPPVEYLKKLKEQGSLFKIYTEMAEAVK